MRWKSKAEERNNAKKEWHDFFTLIPRKIEHEGEYIWVWLETIQRIGHLEIDWREGLYWVYNYKLK